MYARIYVLENTSQVRPGQTLFEPEMDVLWHNVKRLRIVFFLNSNGGIFSIMFPVRNFSVFILFAIPIHSTCAILNTSKSYKKQVSIYPRK